MGSAKSESCPLGPHFKLTSKQSPEKKAEIEYMKNIPYASAVGSLIYLKGTAKVSICYGDQEAFLEGYTDMAGDIDSKRSTSGYMFTFVGRAVSWQSKLQKCATLSTMEAEYIAITEYAKELLWLKRFFKEIRDVVEEKQLFIEKVNTKDNGDDMLTKNLPKPKHEVCCTIAGLSIVQESSSSS
ncbi:hypothetical protein LIER_18798 [Lithospermum erythrorhizon]|uniref:Retrovirus-related Pol polyprotein from transposon TNT 1-94 n=1 Tax=Lithospermum erythrorhizon TaxID=34254 RepID=A0AAV3QGZ6_LITER